MGEDSNRSAAIFPLLGTSTSQVAENTGKSQEKAVSRECLLRCFSRRYLIPWEQPAPLDDVDQADRGGSTDWLDTGPQFVRKLD